MQQQLHADKVIPSIPENKYDKYRSQPGKRESHNATNCIKIMQSGYAEFKVPTGKIQPIKLRALPAHNQN